MNGFPAVKPLSFVPGANPPTGTWTPSRPTGSGSGPVYLYGLYEQHKDGWVCHYVGQTLMPKCRRSAHSREFTFRVLRRCKSGHSTRLETQIIQAYKRRGQCSLNKRKTGGPTAIGRWSNPVVWIEKMRVFRSPSEAARYFKVCPKSIRGWIKSGAPSFYKVNPTLKYLRKLLD